eukprot:3539744-Rhodomonas_salina.2
MDAMEPLEIARCKDDQLCLLCVLSENEKITCPFKRRSITWFYSAHQALIMLASMYEVFRERVMRLEQQHLINAMELVEWIINNSDTTPGKICPEYLCVRAKRFIDEQDGKLSVCDVKVLHSVAMITLNVRDNAEKLKHMQTEEIRRCQEKLDSRAAELKQRSRRVAVEGQKQSIKTALETIAQRSKRRHCGVRDEERFLTDLTSEGLGKVVIVKRTGGTRGLGLFASVDIEAHRYVCEY